MNMSKMGRWFGLALMTTFCIVATSFAPIGMGNPTHPALAQNQGLQACIPDWNGFFTRHEIVGSTQYEEKEYFLIHLYQPETPIPDPLVVSRPVGGGDCTQEFLNIGGSPVSLSHVLGNNAFAQRPGREIARPLILALYRRELERLGQEGLQRQVNEAASAEASVAWWEEEIWALQQLGITIPDNVVIRGRDSQ